MNELRLHRMAFPVTNLGFGRRLVIWTQGCKFKCPACCSINTHDLNGGILRPIDQWLSMSETILNGTIPDGLTISGGEPTLQSECVCSFISAFRSKYPQIDVLFYSGETWQTLEKEFQDLIRLSDVVVSEPFKVDIPPISHLTGSGNQTIHLLTPLANQRYINKAKSKSLLVTSVDNHQISAVGIPDQSLDQLTKALAKRGIKLNQPSWRR